jgi:hypothetical protein
VEFRFDLARLVRLQDKIAGAGAHNFYKRKRIAETRHHQYVHIGETVVEGFDEFNPMEPRHDHVRDDDVEVFGFEQANGFVTRRDERDLAAHTLDQNIR